MSLHGPSRVGKHIAPASDLIIDEDNKLRISFVDIFKNKMPHLLKWQRFKNERNRCSRATASSVSRKHAV
jgi:hypothetical protein